MLSNLRLGCRRRPLMRFARGTLGVGSLYVCSFAVMALPGFLLFLCDFKKREQLKEKDTYPLVFCSIRMFFFLQAVMHRMQQKKPQKKQLDKLQSLALYGNIYCGCGKLSCKYSIYTVINCIYISGLFTSCISK